MEAWALVWGGGLMPCSSDSYCLSCPCLCRGRDCGLHSPCQHPVVGVCGLPGLPVRPPAMEGSRPVGGTALAQLPGTQPARVPTVRPGTATRNPAQVPDPRPILCLSMGSWAYPQLSALWPTGCQRGWAVGRGRLSGVTCASCSFLCKSTHTQSLIHTRDQAPACG